MEFAFITIFPSIFEGVLSTGVLGVASRKGMAGYSVVNLRDFAVDRHGSVDDYPYGGGPGMILMVQPVVEAVESVYGDMDRSKTSVVLMSPCGRQFSQQVAEELAGNKKIIFICGRYKGVDERINDLVVTDRISIGDFILSGGELPALMVADSVVRYLPGVLGNEESRDTDSFSGEDREQLLDSAYYTKPREYRGLKVPEPLISGDHARIEEWRRNSAAERTERFRGGCEN
ncbi:MAG: tRNA (guanosine(37)-N1)-methyltransferase TrmD [Candidatus Latescibacteria bacterium]|nr:tRNA (guanosine(37)-N1)-methyltransferase TrmD [bacterium]MBD3422887.1 tRNA (guanosine(37)-N1)-methyltransferase TrmD [Candidatus Latescibacterota bacterium]